MLPSASSTTLYGSFKLLVTAVDSVIWAPTRADNRLMTAIVQKRIRSFLPIAPHGRASLSGEIKPPKGGFKIAGVPQTNFVFMFAPTIIEFCFTVRFVHDARRGAVARQGSNDSR